MLWLSWPAKRAVGMIGEEGAEWAAVRVQAFSFWHVAESAETALATGGLA